VTLDPDQQRAMSRRGWEEAAAGWGRNADLIRDWGMPVSSAMIDRLELQPGHRILELAAGPGDTGFMAAELVSPGGTLICSDGAQAMLEIARARAAQVAVSGVEFRQLELEWIDLETASVDAILCRWGLMLTVDPAASAQEMRRVLRPEGRVALAVWDPADANPWATLPSRTLIELGLLEAPDPAAPSMFSLGEPGRLVELLAGAGFVDFEAESVPVTRRYDGIDAFVYETRQMSPSFGPVMNELGESARAEVIERLASALEPFTEPDGAEIVLPGSSLVVGAGA
jgi:ubiquinone/menaquinone biosynthesis C-methylase UbiE